MRPKNHSTQTMPATSGHQPKGRARRAAGALRDRSGATAVEFAMIAPALLLIMGAIVDFGVTMNNYVELTDAVRVGARQFVISGSSATPMTSATTAIDNAAPNLTAGSITVTYRVNGTGCATDTACATALAADAGGTATLTATYPCSAPVGGVTVLQGCTLTSATTEMVE
jgi:Flp pilus assembly protein TadG